MATLRTITPAIADAYREVRLRALRDSPLAFGSTYAAEVLLPDAEWKRRAKERSGELAMGLLAFDGQAACGMAAGFVDEEDVRKVHLVSMWVAPTHRRSGAGRMLVEGVMEWARLRGAATMCLMVTSCNEGAMRFYERLGFIKTGRTEPYPNDVSLVEFEMVRALGKGDKESGVDRPNESIPIRTER